MNRKLMAGGALAVFLLTAVGVNAYHIDDDGCHDTVPAAVVRLLCKLDDNNSGLEVPFAGDPLYWDLFTTITYPAGAPPIVIPDPFGGPPLFVLNPGDIIFGLILCEQGQFIGNLLFPIPNPTTIDFSTEGHGGLCFMSPGYITNAGGCVWNGLNVPGADWSFDSVPFFGDASPLGRSNGNVPAFGSPSVGDVADKYATIAGPCTARGYLDSDLPIIAQNHEDWFTVQMIPSLHNNVNPNWDLAEGGAPPGHRLPHPPGSACPQAPPAFVPPTLVETYDCVSDTPLGIPFGPQYLGVNGPATLMASYDASDAYTHDYGHISGFPIRTSGTDDGSYRMNHLGKTPLNADGCPFVTPIPAAPPLPFCVA